jgi:YidC/Oxa1 family membrane protein insertase
MEKRLVLALLMSVAFFLLWTWLFPPPAPQPPPDQGAPYETIAPGRLPPEPRAPGDEGGGAATPVLNGAAIGTTHLPSVAGATAAVKAPGVAEDAEIGAEIEETISVDTDLYAIQLTNRGARVTSWKLKDYLDDEGDPLELISPAAAQLEILPLQVLVDDPDATARLRDALYRIERNEDTVEGRRFTKVTFTYGDGRGLAASKTLRIASDGYLGDIQVATQVGGRPVTPYLVWGAGFGRHTGLESGYYADGSWAVANIDGSVELKGQGKIKPGEPWLLTGSVTWAGMSDKYFAAVLVPDSPVQGNIQAEMHRLVREGREQFYLSMVLLLPGVNHYTLFVGPKDHDVLQTLDRGLDGLLDFGFFSIIALPMFKALKFLHGYLGNYGWAIIVLTIAIRLLLFPFMHKSQVNMKKMQDQMKKVQPKLKAMRERYKKLERKEIEKKNVGARQRLRQKMNEETMALYKTEGINPMGQMSGCLMLLLQMPIFLGFLKVLTLAIELRKAPFILWIRDLSQKDPFWITPIVMGATMLVQQMMMSSAMPDPTQRRIMYLMPIVFTFFMLSMPSGLVVYWLVNNLLAIGQQYLVNRQVQTDNKAA